VERTQRAPAVRAGLGLLLWGVTAALFLGTGADDGAHLGAGAVGFLAVVLSLWAADGLAASAGTTAARLVGRACTVGWGVWLLAAVTGVVPRDLQLALGLVPLALLVGCFVLALRLPGRQGG
jgi:hypothetical protein